MHRKHSPKRSGKPPRWLVLGALAASTGLNARPAPAATSAAGSWKPARESASGPSDPSSGQPVITAQTTLASLLEANANPLAPAERRVPGEARSPRPFDIPPGNLETVLAAFTRATGIAVRTTDLAIHALASPGVSGTFTAADALDRLLLDTGVYYRFTAAKAVELSLTTVSESIDVTVSPSPSSPKYTEALLNIPQTLTVIPQKLMQEQGAATLRDVLRNVTGISIQAGEGGGGLPGDNLSIRGFAARNDVYVDGVRDFGAYSRDPFNIDQVEVSKGPASLYGGRGSTGGSLNLSSKRPLLTELKEVTVAGGTDSYGRATIDYNQPLEGLSGAAFRINGMWTQGGVAGRDAVENERWGIAPSLAFGLDSPTRVTLSYSHLDQDNLPEYGIPWVPPTNVPLARYADQPAPVSFDNFYGLRDRDYEKTVTGIANAELAHDFNDATTLRSLVRYGKAERDSIITAPRFVSNDSTLLNRQLQSRDLEDDILALQNDLTSRFSTGGVEHAVVAGVEVARENSKNYARTGPTAPVADLFNPDPDAPYAGPVTRTGARTESQADTIGVYASDTLHFGEHWQVVGGLRWDRFDIDFDSVAVGGVLTPFERTDSELSWRSGVVYKPVPQGSVYLSYGTSFNPSADGVTGLSLAANTVDLEPEKSRGYELGTKWDLAAGGARRLSVSAAVFRTEKTNARTPGIDPGDPPLVLEGEQRIDGVELGLTGQLTSGWSAFLGYTFLDSEVVRSNTPAEVGNPLANTPRHSGNLWTTYHWARGFELGGGINYVDDRYNNNTAVRVAPAYTLLDLTAAYQVNQLLTLRLNVNNLTDKRYIDRVGGGHFIPGAGRSVALTTGFGF